MTGEDSAAAALEYLSAGCTFPLVRIEDGMADDLQALKKDLSETLSELRFALSSIALALYAVKEGDDPKLASEVKDLVKVIDWLKVKAEKLDA